MAQEGGGTLETRTSSVEGEPTGKVMLCLVLNRLVTSPHTDNLNLLTKT